VDGERKELDDTFRHGHTKCGFDDFVSWDDLMDEKQDFMVYESGMICIDVRLTISNIKGISPSIDFTSPDDSRHDVALMFNGEKLFACKQV
ncbi:hypothetical protein PMAYCL1PPCAC_01036, partial [Pristionchus mayeri]